MYKNIEGYSDPTAGEAISRVVGEQKRKERAERHMAQKKRKREPRGRNTREHKDKPLRKKEEDDT